MSLIFLRETVLESGRGLNLEKEQHLRDWKKKILGKTHRVSRQNSRTIRRKEYAIKVRVRKTSRKE